VQSDGDATAKGIEKGALSERGAPFSHFNQCNRRTIVSDSRIEEPPVGEPKDPQTDTSNSKPEEERPVTEDPDGTPKENPSGG
jgi:hypothetical protein